MLFCSPSSRASSRPGPFWARSTPSPVRFEISRVCFEISGGTTVATYIRRSCVGLPSHASLMYNRGLQARAQRAAPNARKTCPRQSPVPECRAPRSSTAVPRIDTGRVYEGVRVEAFSCSITTKFLYYLCAVRRATDKNSDNLLIYDVNSNFSRQHFFFIFPPK